MNHLESPTVNQTSGNIKLFITQIGIAKNSKIASGLIKKILFGVNSEVVKIKIVATMEANNRAIISLVM